MILGGPSGVWTKDSDDERRAYESYEQFLKDPREYRDERLRAPSLLCDLTKVAPNPGHYALAEIESMDIMKSLITQNVDVLHERAGSGNVIEYHGSYSKL